MEAQASGDGGDRDFSARGRWWAAIVIPSLVAAATFANTLSNGFAGDDPFTYLELLKADLDWTCLVPHMRCVTSTVHLFDRWMWPYWKPGFHLTNLFLHCVATALAAGAALRISGSARVALASGVLFAVHPVHVEAVASFSNRKDILAMIFAMLALLAWTSRRAVLLRLVASTVCLLIGMFAKEVAVVGIAVMLPIASILLPRDRPMQKARWIGAVLVIALPAVGLVMAQKFTGGILSRLEAETIAEVIRRPCSYREVVLTCLATVPEVFRLLFVPGTLAVDYPVAIVSDPGDVRVIMGAGLLVGWVSASLALWRRAPVVSFGMLWTVVMVLPISNVVPVIHHFVAERFLYVPSFGVCLSGAAVLEAALRRAPRPSRVVLVMGALCIALAGGLRAVSRNRDWRDQLALTSSALAEGIETADIHRARGIQMLAREDGETAEAHFRRAIELDPNYAGILMNPIAASLVLGGEPSQVRARSGDPDGMGLVCKALFGRGLEDRAVRCLRLALKEEPGAPDLQTDLALVLATASRARVRDAGEAARLARSAQPRSPLSRAQALVVLAIALTENGDFDGALAAAEEAGQLSAGIREPQLASVAEMVAARARQRQPVRMQPKTAFEILWRWSFPEAY